MEKIMIIQQISTICDNLPAKMKKAKEEQHKTNQQIIDSTGLSESTVKKFFSGHLSGPSIYDVTAMAIDLGLSLDELMELSHPKQDQSAEINQLKTEIAHKQEMIAEKDKAISRLEDRSHIMENEISTVRSNWKEIAYVTSGLSVLFGLFLMVYVFLDLRNPNLGLFRGTTAAPIVYVAAFTIIGTCLYIIRTAVKRNAKRRKRDANNTH
uniref:SOS-response transcriptional repressor n=1 Tax=Siphoviridae sp. ct3pR10 TaxID=2826284 RepID=A0A8S5LWR9_9CAUD|nr:MAG TPA: SOS-response transcriptional repressor [Siphoviridae sp. ct3pR10]